MNENTSDIFFMRHAVAEAVKAREKGEVPIGAVIVHGGKIVARSHNLVETLNDPTAHAEMQAITVAAAAAGGKYLPQCRMYVTVEPCPMCAGACFWSQLGEVVYGAADPKRGAVSTKSESLFHPKTIVRGGILEEECAELISSFFSKLR